MDFKNDEWGENEDGWDANLLGVGPHNPTVWDKALPLDSLRRLKCTNMSYFAQMPTNPITVLESPSTDCSINLTKLADLWMRENFLTHILFPHNCASYYDFYKEFDERIDVTDVLYSSDSPLELEACQNFISVDNTDWKRKIDLILHAFMNAKTLLEICGICLNAKKFFAPHNQIIPFILHQAFLIINVRQALYLYNEDGHRLEYNVKQSYFRQITEVILPDTLKDNYNFERVRPVYDNFKIFRNMIWSQPSPTKSHRLNQPILLEDKSKILWDLKPYRPHFTRTGNIYLMTQVQNSDYKSNSNEVPDLQGLVFYAKMKTSNGGVIIDPDMAQLAMSKDLTHAKMFEGFPDTLVVIDLNQKRGKLPNFYDGKWIEVVPLVVKENGQTWFLFCEQSFYDNFAKGEGKNIYGDCSSLLTIWGLRYPDTNLLGFDNLIPKYKRKYYEVVNNWDNQSSSDDSDS